MVLPLNAVYAVMYGKIGILLMTVSTVPIAAEAVPGFASKFFITAESKHLYSLLGGLKP